MEHYSPRGFLIPLASGSVEGSGILTTIQQAAFHKQIYSDLFYAFVFDVKLILEKEKYREQQNKLK